MKIHKKQIGKYIYLTGIYLFSRFTAFVFRINTVNVIPWDNFVLL
jgi:hypothetical protein